MKPLVEIIIKVTLSHIILDFMDSLTTYLNCRLKRYLGVECDETSTQSTPEKKP